MSKKILSILLALGISASFVACGGKTANVEPTEAPAEVTEAPTEAPTEVPTEAPTAAPVDPTAVTPGEGNSAGNFTITKATKIDLDGVTNEAEWASATVITASADAVAAGTGFANSGNLTTGTAAAQKMLWADDGLYIAYSVADTSKTDGIKLGDSLNGTDAVQTLFDPMNKKTDGDASKELYIFDFVSATGAKRDGEAAWFEHFQYNGMPDIGVKVMGADSETGYTIEAFIPWTALQKNGESFTPAVGYKFGTGLLSVDYKNIVLVDLYGSYGKKIENLTNASYFFTATLG